MNRNFFTTGFMNFSCRICLERNPENLVSIGEKLASNITICDVIQYCTSVQTSLFDPLPQYICKICLDRLRTAHQLKTLYINTSNILKRSQDEIENVVNLKVNLPPKNQSDLKHDESTTSSSSSTTDEIKSEMEWDKSRVTASTPTVDDKKELGINSNPENANSAEQLSFVCKLCRFPCASLEYLNLHLSINHPQPQSKGKGKGAKKKIENQCKVCKLILSDRSNLILHRRSEHPEIWKHVCLYCQKSFNLKILLTQHINVVHLKILKFECLKCHQKFGQRSQLNKHVCEYAADTDNKMMES